MKVEVKNKKIKHAKDLRCCEENEEYYLNRHIVKAPTEGMVYYYQKVDGLIVKTEVTLFQWKKLYNFNRKTLRRRKNITMKIIGAGCLYFWMTTGRKMTR